MKQNKEIEMKIERDCEISGCLKCEICHAVNYEEARTVSPESRKEPLQLYGYEALSYFYFMPTLNHAVR